MKLWFAIPFGTAMIAYPALAEWFVCSCVVLAIVFSAIIVGRALRGQL